MSSLFKKPQMQAKKGRNGFDMSRRRIYTSPVGMLLPVYDDFANPGDKYKLNSSAFIRTEAVETSAFIRMKYHVDWFFVPITQLFQFWNEYFYSTNDVTTSFGSGLNSYSFPFFNIKEPILNFLAHDYFATPNAPATSYNLEFDEMGIPRVFHLRRLFDLFGYGSVDTQMYPTATQKPVQNTLGLKYLAYHRIFYSHYNLNDFFKQDQTLFNVDYLAGKTYGVGGSDPKGNLVDRIVSTIHYRPYRKDYFNNIVPSPTFNNSFANFILNNQMYRSSGDFFIEPSDDNVSNGFQYNNRNTLQIDQSEDDILQSYGVNISGTNIAKNGISLGDIRNMYALDKLLRITANAGSHYDQQTLAHFGVKLPEGIKNEAYYLGEQVTDININEVVASASTGATENGSPLAGSTIGDIAGKGFGATRGNKDISFTAPCHGIIMAIASIEPIADYASMGCERDNRILNAYDFFHPEFDNVGMQPMFNCFFNYNYIGADRNSNQINGWQYRYSEFKTKFDVVNESVWNTYRHVWSGFKQFTYLYKDITANNIPSLFQLFYICPQYCNNIFMQRVPQYTGDNPLLYTLENQELPANQWSNVVVSPTNCYYGDNFLINLDVKAFKSSIMSVHSLPNI